MWLSFSMYGMSGKLDMCCVPTVCLVCFACLYVCMFGICGMFDMICVLIEFVCLA